MPAIIISGIGLLAIPVGTLLHGYFLYLLLSQKGKTVFSDGYKQIIVETPCVKNKTSNALWIVLGILVSILAIFIILAVIMEG